MHIGSTKIIDLNVDFFSLFHNLLTEIQQQRFSNMLFTAILLSLIASTATAAPTADPVCARHGFFESTKTNLESLLQPPLQIEALRCANICRLAGNCGAFASSGMRLPTDWCLIFKKSMLV